MLNTINACANIHWYCHECNAANRNISAALDRINDVVGLMTNSLSKDLGQFVGGFKEQMEKFTDIFSSAVVSKITSVSSNGSGDNTMERNCDDDPGNISTYESEMKTSSPATLISDQFDEEPPRSIVISNIGKDVSADHLKGYLSDKLKIGKDKLNVYLLLPSNRTVDNLSFLQYKVVIPEATYRLVVNPKFWPANVRVRDFVLKKRKTQCVTKQNFLDSLCTMDSF